MRQRTSKWAAATALLAWSIGTSPAWSAPASAPLAGSVQPAASGTPPLSGPLFDPLPHQLHPNDWPQPDYFTEALKLTPFRPGARFSALKLAPGLEPEVLVLPLQMQAFGWTPAFIAVIGARLDHELVVRRLNANRQTDLFDADGPFVRRFDESQIKAFAAEHPRARVLALYLGRDAAGKDFVTMTLRLGGRLAIAHRIVDERAEPLAALDAIGSVLPALLSEVGLIGTSSARIEPAQHCDPGIWNLDGVTANSDLAARACHALVLGTLLPEFDLPTRYSPRPKTPAKLAWLAQAYVEADSLASPTALALRTVAWSQLELTQSYATVGSVVDSDDPVVRPVARLLWARERTAQLPVKSQDAAAEAYAAAEAVHLPPFAQAAFTERANFEESFRPVDICSLERLLPAMRLPAECVGSRPTAPLPLRSVTGAQQALLDEWRLARSYKDLNIQGKVRADPQRRQAVADALPLRMAAHPFIRQELFITDKFDRATGAFAPLVQRALVAVTDFVQATADIQRMVTPVQNNSVGSEQWTTNDMLLSEPRIDAVAKSELRMTNVLLVDGFNMREKPPRMIQPNIGWNYLRPGPMVLLQRPPPEVLAQRASVSRQPLAAANAGAASAPSPDAPPFFMAEARGGNGLPVSMLEQTLAGDRMDMTARMELALSHMKAGQSVMQARAFVDERPVDRRYDSAVGESRAWAMPGHEFFFAGELDAARFYYERVVQIGTGSESELHARMRLRLIAGDVPGALQATHVRLERYEGDFTRRDLAGLEFMSGRPDRAWEALRPRLPQSGEIELWIGASVGQRMQGMTARQVRDWIAASGYGNARVKGTDIVTAYLNRFMLDDRLPTDDDVALAKEIGQQPSSLWSPQVAAVSLKRLAFAGNVDDASLRGVRELISGVRFERRTALKPLYVWVAWRASDGKDPTLTLVRDASLAGDFDSMLAKGMLLGLENNPGQAMQYLRAARIELAELSNGRMSEELRSAPYAAALTSYLLYDKTKEPVYREEALRVAHAYARIFPFLAWPYALDALLSPDSPTRGVAACRARYLDRDSLFLRLSGLRPDVASPTCSKVLW